MPNRFRSWWSAFSGTCCSTLSSVPWSAVLRGVGLDTLARPANRRSGFAAIAVSAWANMGFPILIFLAAILGIPSSELTEAAGLTGLK